MSRLFPRRAILGVTVTPAIYIGAVVPSYTEDFGDKDAFALLYCY